MIFESASSERLPSHHRSAPASQTRCSAQDSLLCCTGGSAPDLDPRSRRFPHGAFSLSPMTLTPRSLQSCTVLCTVWFQHRPPRHDTGLVELLFLTPYVCFCTEIVIFFGVTSQVPRSCRSANTHSAVCPLLPVESSTTIGAVLHSAGAVQDGDIMCCRPRFDLILSGVLAWRVDKLPVM